MIKETSKNEWKKSQEFELNWWRATLKRVGKPLIGCPRFSQDWDEELKEDAKGKIVVDIGSGPLGGIVRGFDCKIGIAIDPLNNQFEKIGWIIQDKCFIPLVAPAESLPLIGNFADIVCTMNALDHMKNVDRAISEMVRILKIGGRLYINVDLRKKHLICEGHKICLEVDYFNEIAKKYNLKIIKEQIEKWEAKGVIPTYVGIFQKENKVENSDDDITRTPNK